MRLTVHLEELEKQKVEVDSKDSKGTTTFKMKLFNTLSFDDVSVNEANSIIAGLEGEGKKIKKHYLSEMKVPGRAFVKKKK